MTVYVSFLALYQMQLLTSGVVCCEQIPGLNAPIPPGAQFGYQPGGWGKPPVDEEGNPLYGDVFGQYEHDAEEELARSSLFYTPTPSCPSRCVHHQSGIGRTSFAARLRVDCPCRA